MKRKAPILALLVLVLSVGLIVVLRPGRSAETPETRIVEYLDETVAPGRPVLVTDLYNTVFTTTEERATLEGLYASLVQLPAFAAQTYLETDRIPSLEDLSDRFAFQGPRTTDVLLRVLEADPRVPRFFDRDSSSGEIIRIYVDAIEAHERFGGPLRN